MSIFAPVLLTFLAWWLSTGIVLLLNHLPVATYKYSLALVTILSVLCLANLQNIAADDSTLGVMLAFLQALCLWSWLEMTYLMGWLTGVSKQPCPAGCQGFQRFVMALKTSIYHELAVIAVGMTIVALTWDAPNPFCMMAFLVLWLMRWSAKLNLFLGVANLNVEWYPEKMQYLTTYMRSRPMNPLFPFSMLFAGTALVYLIATATSTPMAHLQTGYILVASLLGLAILEHIFLVVQLGDTALWRWALRDDSRHSSTPVK